MTMCPTCGGAKKDHSKVMWDAHKKMHDTYTKMIKDRVRRLKKMKAANMKTKTKTER